MKDFPPCCPGCVAREGIRKTAAVPLANCNVKRENEREKERGGGEEVREERVPETMAHCASDDDGDATRCIALHPFLISHAYARCVRVTHARMRVRRALDSTPGLKIARDVSGAFAPEAAVAAAPGTRSVTRVTPRRPPRVRLFARIS